MATAATIDVLLRANTAQYRAEMINSGRIANQSLGAIRKEAAQTAQSIQTLNRAAAGFVGFQALRAATGQLARVADQYSNIQAKVRLAAGENANLTQSMDRVFEVAQRTFNTFDGTSALVQRGATALRNFGQDADTAFNNSLALAETFNKALVISGASSSEASAAALQFSQALASGRFQGDEFRSVLENNSRFAQLLADSLGVNIAQLRELSKAGKLTTTDMLGLLSRTQELDAEFERMPTTIGRAKTQLDNAFTKFIGEADQAYGVSRTFAGGMQALAQNIEPVLAGVGQLAVVTAGAITARTLQGLQAYGKAVLDRAEGDRLAAAAAAQRAQADAAANAVALTRARADQITAEQSAKAATADRIRIEQTIALAKSQEAMIRANALRATSEVELARLGQQLTAVEAARLAATEALGAARQREIALNAALVTSNRNLGVAMQAAGVAGAATGTKISVAMRAGQAATAAMTLAARGLSAALAFVGGPLGLVIIGLGVLATKLMSAKAEADALRDSARGAAEGLANLNRESSAGQILGAGAAALAERQKLRDAIAKDEAELRFGLGGLAEDAGLGNIRFDPTGVRERLDSNRAALAEVERQLARTAKLADEYRGAQQGANGATEGGTQAAGEYAAKLAAEAEQLRLQRFELEKGLKARLLLEAMQAQGVTSVEALDAATREHIETIVREKGAIEAANDARKAGVSGERAAEREAKRQANEQKRLQEEMKQAALQANTELQSILQGQGAMLGGPALQAAQDYANEMVRLLGIEQALAAAGKLTAEAQAQIAIARQQNFEIFQKQVDQPSVAEQMLSDAKFELELLRMTNAERATAVMLRGREAEFTAEQVAELRRLNEQYERERELTQQMDQFRQTMVNTFSSILDGTKSVGEAFKSMADAIISQIANLIAQQWVDKLFGKQGQAGGGFAGDGIASFLGSFLGFDQGGYTGPGGKLQPAGVVHKGEVVWSQVDVARAGGVAVVEAMRRGLRGYADGGWANGSAAVTVRGSNDGARSRGIRRGLSIGKIEMVTQGATSNRSLERQRQQLNWALERAAREFG